MKKTTTFGRHWGDRRAQLEIAINEVLEFYRDKSMNYPECATESEDFIAMKSEAAFVINNYYAYEQMTVLVRKELSIALRNLAQHGLVGNTSMEPPPNSMINTALAPAAGSIFGFGCFSTKSSTAIIKSRPAHIWEVILYYYDIKVIVTKLLPLLCVCHCFYFPFAN